jgi:DtxR family transcriptional regulator, Mn-dependent transcriptional regulator
MSKTNSHVAGIRKEGEVSSSMQDMLETVLRLGREKGAARVRDLAAALGVHKSTVTAALKRLAREGLVRYRPYELVALEPAGLAVAERVSGGHAGFARFLSDVLLMDPKEADADACRLEHAAGPETIERLKLFAAFLADRPAASGSLRRAFAARLAARPAPGRDGRA